MKKTTKPLGAAILAATVWMAAAPPTAAQTGGDPEGRCTRAFLVEGPAPSEATAYDLLETAMEDGPQAMGRHRAGLKAALDQAPADYPLIEKNGARWVAHAGAENEIAVMFDMSMKDPEVCTIVMRPNVYPLMAFVLGADAVARESYDEALSYLDRGLAWQPTNWHLVSERVAALHGKKQRAESLAYVDEVLALKDPLLDPYLASLQLERGRSLSELGRLPEAEAAYRKALEIAPGEQKALDGLRRIQSLTAAASPE